MNIQTKKGFLLVLTAGFTLSYLLISPAVNLFQGMFPEGGRIALDFFQPFRPITPTILLITLLRGAVIALILLPARHLLSTRLLFLTLWGLTLVCSLEPIPGTLEGMIYTRTTWGEHLLILAGGAVQMALCASFYAFMTREVSS